MLRGPRRVGSPDASSERVRRLHFDLDGTVVDLATGGPKSALAGGALESAIREARFDEIVCIGNFVGVIRLLRKTSPEYDGHHAIFELCGGAFTDETWFRGITRLVVDPARRAAEVEIDSDWWYMDDEGERYFRTVGLGAIWERHLGSRILRPSPTGSGDDVLDWLRTVGKSRTP